MLFSKDLGKISAVAKGARKSRKRFGGALDPFTLIEVSLAKGRGSSHMYRLAEATQIDSHHGLASNLERLGSAAFILELVRELTPEHEPDPRIFDLICETFALLSSDTQFNTHCLTICAVLRILALGGLAVAASRCNACGSQVPERRRVLFDARRGGIICTPCGGGPITLSAGSAALLALLEKSTLHESVAIEIEKDHLHEIETALDIFVEHQLEKPLRTSSFRHQVSQNGLQKP